MTQQQNVGQLWDDRFSSVPQAFLYGTRPNAWIEERLPQLDQTAKVLALADGEGRNAVWLARQGYDTENWDYSQVGLNKTQQLAQHHHVKVTTRLVDLTDCTFEKDQFDAVVASFFHLPKQYQCSVWQDISQIIKPNGHLIVQVFAESQLGRSSGGPKDVNLLYKSRLFEDALSTIT